MITKIFQAFLLFSILLVGSAVHAQTFTSKLSGKILLQVEDKGQAWYVDPSNGERAYLGRPSDAFRIMRELGLGITEKDYAIFIKKTPSRLSGKILIRAESKGEAYYVDTTNLKLYYLGRPDDAFKVMRELGLGISNADLAKITVSKKYNENVETKSNVVRLYSFYGEGCPHCTKENLFLEELKKEFLDIQIIKFEIWHNEENTELYERVKERFDLNVGGVPLLVIGEETVYGFGENETTGEEIRGIIKRQLREGSKDIVFPLQKNVYQVSKVVDGDTLDVLIDGQTKRVRIIGVDTPEIVDASRSPECFGQEASDEAKNILNRQYVMLESDASQDDKDKYGRLLRHIFLPGNVNFGEWMIVNGFAKEYTYSQASKYQSVYIEAQKIARDNKKGLWGICEGYETETVKSGIIDSDSDVYISYIFFDGFENPSEGDEYVVIKNKGNVMDLKNFTLSDKSGKQFLFPSFNLDKDKELKIYTGCGNNDNEKLYWCFTESAIWNNGGDTAYLKDGTGKLIATYTY